MSQIPARVDSEHYDEQWSWASLARTYATTGLPGADGFPGTDGYPGFMTDALVETFGALDGWAVPLAVSLDFDVIGARFQQPIPSLMLLADELSDEIPLREGWQEWAEPKPVVRIDGELIRTIVHEHLARLNGQDDKFYELQGIQFLACRFAIGPEPLPETFILSSWRGTDFRTVRTTTADGKRWISEPQTENQAFLPVALEIAGTDAHSHRLDFTMDPVWSYFGDKDRPGWQMVAGAADRLLAASPRWSIERLVPGDPAKR